MIWVPACGSEMRRNRGRVKNMRLFVAAGQSFFLGANSRIVEVVIANKIAVNPTMIMLLPD
jgi:hypothetical protein